MSDASASPIDNWRAEMRSAHLYAALAEIERSTPRAELFARLAGEARTQAALWADVAKRAGVPVPGEYGPDLRTRLVAALARRYGPRNIRGVLAAMKVRGLSVYTHAQPGHPAPTSIDEMATRHRGLRSGSTLRAAVFGVNDGLVSNASLILGVAGAAASSEVILLTGVAGLLAGAFSMAAGEWVSVRSQREMFQHQIGLERAELAQYPAEEARELALIYEARGLPKREAEALGASTIADPGKALDTLAREELGLNPDELGSPWRAAASSLLSFALGALIPLAPFLFLSPKTALYVALGLAAVALFSVGAVISLFTGRSAVKNGLRMLAIGAAAGALTYVIGSLLGVTIG